MRNAEELIRRALNAKPMALDSTTDETATTFDAASSAMHSINDIKMSALEALVGWVESDSDTYEEGESEADRLLGLMVGVSAGSDIEDDLSDTDQEVLDIALECVEEYLSKYGVDKSDIDALLDDWDEDAADRIKSLLADSIPEGDEATSEIEGMVFDSVALDAAYKKVVAIRGGKKVRIKKRVSGRVKLSGKQKAGLKKAQRKSHSSAAKMKRMKSMKLRKRSGL